MLVVSPLAMPHLVAAVQQELVRLEALCIQEGDDWDEYEGNDPPLFEWGLKALADAQAKGSDVVDLAGKPRWFLTGLLPDYVRRNLDRLSRLEHQALMDVYLQHPVTYAGEFPPLSDAQ